MTIQSTKVGSHFRHPIVFKGLDQLLQLAVFIKIEHPGCAGDIHPACKAVIQFIIDGTGMKVGLLNASQAIKTTPLLLGGKFLSAGPAAIIHQQAENIPKPFHME